MQIPPFALVARLQQRLNRAVAERVFPGASLGVALGEAEAVITVGRHTYEADSSAVTPSTVFDVASITKAIPVSCLALWLIDAGRLKPADRVADVIPELSNRDRDAVLVHHLLTQTLHFGFQLSAVKDLPPESIIEAITSREFASPPGARCAYANATSILLGMVIERVTGELLPALASRVFFGPLGMASTTFHPRELDEASIAPTEDDPWRGRAICGEVHDESAWALRPRMVAGSAGLFSTAPDLLRFVRMLLRGGVAGNRTILSGSAIRSMATNQLDVIGERTGLGWELSQPRFMGARCSASAFGKTGFTGCSCVVDVGRGAGIVLLSNATFPRRRADRSAIEAVRREVADSVWETVVG
jgi:CubicO group peptidase (beta-lactamase class C family)